MEMKVIFKGFQYRSSQDKANKNSLDQDEVGGGCLQRGRWLTWSSARACVCVREREILLFIYFSGGENGLAQLILRLALAYGGTGGGGGSIKIENRASGNA